MRRFLFFIVLLLMCSSIALAHSGGTDSRGGHYDRSTGTYHYHHGKPAHQHPGGVCPYSSATNTPKPVRASTSSSTKQKNITFEDFVLRSPYGALTAVGIIVIARKLVRRNHE